MEVVCDKGTDPSGDCCSTCPEEPDITPSQVTPADITPATKIPTSGFTSEDATCDSCEESPKSDIPYTAPNIPTDFDPEESDDGDIGVEPEIVTKIYVDKDGVFDNYMNAGYQQLLRLYEEGRIKGADFAAQHIAVMQLMMQQANQFVLQKYQEDIQKAAIEAELIDKKLAASLQRRLLQEQIKAAELNNILLSEKVVTEQLQQQAIATQEEEARKTGSAQRSLITEQANEVRANIELIQINKEETIANGASQRALNDEQAKKIIADTEITITQKYELTEDGVVNRAMREAQTRDVLAAKQLKDTQKTELVKNGHSKRSLEDGQNNVAQAQCELYGAQAEGFRDKAKNDFSRIVSNSWAVSVAEQNNDDTVVFTNGINFNNILGDVAADLGIDFPAASLRKEKQQEKSEE